MWLEVSTHFNFFLLLWGAAERSTCCVYTQIDKLIDIVPDIPRFLGWVISTTLDRLWDVLCFFVSHILARFCLPPVATTAPSLFLINVHQEVHQKPSWKSNMAFQIDVLMITYQELGLTSFFSQKKWIWLSQVVLLQVVCVGHFLAPSPWFLCLVILFSSAQFKCK